MGVVVFLQAYVDFTSDMLLTDVARSISEVCFGGIGFVGENEGIWDEVPALRLDRTILGLEAIVGGRPGADGGYTLQVASKNPLGGSIPVEPEGSKDAICDFSIYVASQIEQIPGVKISKA